MTVGESYELISKDSSIVLLDVRTPLEFAGETGHIADAILIPIQELEKRLNELEPHRKTRIIAYCRTGNRSGIATEFLKKKGFAVVNMEGGIVEWNRQKLPVVFEKEE